MSITNQELIENEEQRKGRNKQTAINRRYINSSKYKSKFDQISNSTKLSRILYQIAKKALNHRSGTQYEDMYWIDLDTLEVVAKETDAVFEKRIEYSNSTEKIIRKYNNLLTVHTHPNSFPPSIDDLNSNFFNNYTIGIVICHDGRVYMYSSNEQINKNYYELVVEGYLKSGYNEDEAQLFALAEIQEHFDIEFKEVIEE